MGSWDIGVLLILGLSVFGGILGASIFQRLRIPQVVGYIAAGVALGDTGLGVVSTDDIAALSSLNLFALAIIGFLVGSELKSETLRRYGKQFLFILLGEGLAAFVLVTLLTGVCVYFVTGSTAAAMGAGVVLGAIASATDPASTMDVLWEYRTRGVLTTTLVAIVALDDALAMALYGLGTAVAQIITGGGASFGQEIAKVSIELFGAIGLGAAAGLLLVYIVRWLHSIERSLALTIGTILLIMGMAVRFNMDLILATMTAGLVLVNFAPRHSQELFSLVRSFSAPIYVLFFVLVGARLSLGAMPLWLWIIVALYVIGRSGGKIAGAWYGARLSKAEPVVQKYTGVGLFAQGGIAVGLAIMASQHLGDIPVTETMMLGDMIIFTVTATTLVVQILGPPLIKWAVKRADEVGRNVTEEDVVESLTVADVMQRDFMHVDENLPLTGVFDILSTHDQLIYPVVNQKNHLTGLMAFEGLKDVVASQDTWPWLVAADVKLPVRDTASAAATLRSALEYMRDVGLEQMLIVDGENNHTPAGILDLRTARRRISEELLLRQQAVA
jgi:Kef-type K+ transport system membrane component KefB